MGPAQVGRQFNFVYNGNQRKIVHVGPERKCLSQKMKNHCSLGEIGVSGGRGGGRVRESGDGDAVGMFWPESVGHQFNLVLN